MTEDTNTESAAVWKRLAATERHQDGFNLRLQHVEKTTDKISANIDLMLERLNQRGDPVSWRQIAAAIVSIAAVGVAVWQWVTWSVENAPITRDTLARITMIETARASAAETNRLARAELYTNDDALIDCLRAEILNRDVGYRCVDARRGIPHNEIAAWTPRIILPRAR